MRRLGAALARYRDERPFHAAAVELLLLTGCRKSEILTLQWTDYREGKLFLRDSKTGPRTVWLSSPARRILDGLPRRGSRVFPSQAAGSPLPPQAMNHFWDRLRAEAGLDDVTLHDARHSYASVAMMQGETVVTIGKLLGHKNPETTLKYIHLDDAGSARGGRDRCAGDGREGVNDAEEAPPHRRERRQVQAGRAEYTVWDSGIAGFGVRVRPSGSRTFVFHCNADGRSRRFSLGRVGVVPIDEARRECLEIRLREAAGGSVNATDRTPVPSFGDFVFGDWTEACRGRHKPSTKKSIDSHLRTQLLPAFGSMPLDRISRAAVIGWFDGYSRTSPGGANRALDTLSRIMNHAIICAHVATNPARGVKRNPGRRMTRFLSRDEIGVLHETLDACVAERPSRGPRADIVRLLLLTGCRSGEIRNLQWREVGEDVLALSDSKTGPRTVYLNRDARSLIARQPRLGSAHVFPSVRDPGRPCSERSLWNFWYMARERAGLGDVRLHDLRHTHASQAVIEGVPLPVVSKTAGAPPGEHDAEIRPCRRPRARGRGREGRTDDCANVWLPRLLNRKSRHDGPPAIV